jgi:hypothetical protein
LEAREGGSEPEIQQSTLLGAIFGSDSIVLARHMQLIPTGRVTSAFWLKIKIQGELGPTSQPGWMSLDQGGHEVLMQLFSALSTALQFTESHSLYRIKAGA